MRKGPATRATPCNEVVAAVQSTSPTTQFKFADLTLDIGLRRVTRDGQVLHLGRLTYEMLVALVEAAPNVVTHDQLAERVWGGRIAAPETVTQRVKLLRLALADDTSHPRYIEVVRGQGCRLIPSVERVSEATLPVVGKTVVGWRPAWRSWPIAAGALLIAAGIGALVWYGRDQEIKSIAVLPFTDMSEGQDQQYVADGIAEEILDRLAQNQGHLRVIARTSSFSFRDQSTDIPEIARKLNVSHVLEGSVRRSGDRIRITVQLVEGAGASHLWSETYDKTLGELFAVQDEIATSVAAALQVTLAEESPLGTPPTNLEAYESYLQGEHYYNRRAPGDIERAVKYYEEAVALDPGYARAWAALSGAYSLMWWQQGRDPAVWRPRQGEAALRAVELDPTLAVTHLRAADYYANLSNRRKAIEHLQRAVALDPDDPWLAAYENAATKWHDIGLEEEIGIARHDVELDPLSSVKRHNLGLKLFAADRLEEARSEFLKAVELNPGISWDTTLEMRRILIAQQRYDDAHASIMQLKESEARDYGLALLYHSPRHRAEADAALGRLNARAGEYMHWIRVAEAYAIRGKIDAAFVTLHRARDGLERDQSILTRIWLFQHESLTAPFLKPLHSDPRWEALVALPAGDSAAEIIEGLWPEPKPASS